MIFKTYPDFLVKNGQNFIAQSDENGIFEVTPDNINYAYVTLMYAPAGEPKPAEGDIAPAEEKPATTPPKEAKKNGNSKSNGNRSTTATRTRKPTGNSRGKPRKKVS